MNNNYFNWTNKKKNSKKNSKKKPGLYGSLNKYQRNELDLIEQDNILKLKEKKIKQQIIDLEKDQKIIKKGREIIKKKQMLLKSYLSK